LFDCHATAYDDDDISTVSEHWIRLDVGVRCFDMRWNRFAFFAGLTIASFSFGFPGMLFLRMSRLRRHVKAWLRLSELPRVRHMMLAGHWTFAKVQDQSCFETDCQCQVAAQSTGGCLKGGASMLQRAHDPSSNLQWSEMKETTAGSPGKAMPRDASDHDHDHDEKGSWVSVFLKVGTFRELSNDEVQALAHLGAACEAHEEGSHERDVWIEIESSTLPHHPSHPVRADESDGGGAPWQGPVRVKMVQKPDVGDYGVMKWVPCTMLDEANHAKCLGQFFDSMEDPYYYWQCWEISRRLLQSSMVVAVIAVGGEATGIAYSVLIAWLGGMLHLYFSPYKLDAMDRLQLLILVNQFIVQMAIAYEKMRTGGASFGLGILLVLCQIVVMSVGMSCIVPAFMPAFQFLWSRMSKDYNPRYDSKSHADDNSMELDAGHPEAPLSSKGDIDGSDRNIGVSVELAGHPGVKITVLTTENEVCGK
ncbi:hypothetical protein CYMTET_26122, partial [Cymbomonas tetramitiformis]